MAQNRKPACCCGCSTTICVSACGVGLAGAVVDLISGGSTVATGTTGITGCVALDIPAAGSYEIRIANGTDVIYDDTATLACGGTTTIAPTVCSQCDFPGTYSTLYVTDSHTTTACPVGGLNFVGCYQLPVGSGAITDCDCFDGGTPFGAGNCTITYSIGCDPDLKRLLIVRYYSTCSETGVGCGYCSDTTDPDCNATGCGGNPGATCGAFGHDQIDICLTDCTLPLTLSLANFPFVCGLVNITSPLGPSITINS